MTQDDLYKVSLQGLKKNPNAASSPSPTKRPRGGNSGLPTVGGGNPTKTTVGGNSGLPSVGGNSTKPTVGGNSGLPSVGTKTEKTVSSSMTKSNVVKSGTTQVSGSGSKVVTGGQFGGQVGRQVGGQV